MSNAAHVRPVTVEFHRLGGVARPLEEGDQYIRTTGWDEPAAVTRVGIGHRDFLKNMNRLRYTGATPAQVSEALERLSAVAAQMLPDTPPAFGDETVQLDLVMGAAELWAFPFEACCRGGMPTFANGQRRVLLTRRIRGEFGEAMPWPATPRVLFVHAPVAADLEKELVEGHIAALEQALRPWKRGNKEDAALLTILPVYALADLVQARANQKFTHIHILAHGQGIPDPDVPQESHWGLRLGSPGTPADEPERLADALKPRAGLPVVVTVAACDSGNQADPTLPTRSLAQELHLRGVPLVVASQLPLTKPGSTLLARHFYEPLLRGEDARQALHEVRVTLHGSPEAGHDWVSLVTYLRLPEGYAAHLEEVGLRTELALLDVAQRRADTLSRDGGTVEQYMEVEDLVRDRIASLERRFRELQTHKAALRHECQGLLASAHKRRAELLFMVAALGGDQAPERLEASRRALDASLEHYRASFHSSIDRHWEGVQQLALEAALRGLIPPSDWTTVLRGAELSRDRSEKEIWALGTLAEVHLLAPFAGRARDLGPARDALALLKARALAAADEFPIASTRRQLARYVEWWTKANDFFPGDHDVREDADELLERLN